MKSAVETLEPTRVKLSVEVPYAELAPAIESAYKEIARDISIPGFRKGKVPPRIIDQRIGFGAVLERAVNAALPDLYRDAVMENDVAVLGQPDVEVTGVPMGKEGELTFTAEVDVRPEITLPELSSIEIEVAPAEVTQADIDERIDLLRQRYATLQGVDRPAADRDFVVLDMTAVIDGEEIDTVSGVSYQIGSGSMLDGMDEALIGMSAGDTKTFTSALAGGDRAGEPAEITATVSQVKEQELPDLDDDFAELASEFDTLEELVADLRRQLETTKVNEQGVEAQQKLLESLLESVEFPVPEAAVQAEVTRHLESEDRLEDSEHRAEVEVEARDALRRQLLLDVLREKLEVGVSQEELVTFLLRLAQQYRVDPNEFISNADRTGQIPVFVGELARNKALAVALRDVTVKDTEGNAVDLTPFIGTEEEEELTAEQELAEAARIVEEAAVVEEIVEVAEEAATSATDAAEAEAVEEIVADVMAEAVATEAVAEVVEELATEAEAAAPAAKKAPAKRASRAKKPAAE